MDGGSILELIRWILIKIDRIELLRIMDFGSCSIVKRGLIWRVGMLHWGEGLEENPMDGVIGKWGIRLPEHSWGNSRRIETRYIGCHPVHWVPPGTVGGPGGADRVVWTGWFLDRLAFWTGFRARTGWQIGGPDSWPGCAVFRGIYEPGGRVGKFFY